GVATWRGGHRVGLRLPVQPIRVHKRAGRRGAAGGRLGTCPARVARRSTGSVHLHAGTPGRRRQPRQEPTARSLRAVRNGSGMGDRGVNDDRSSRDALVRNLVVLVAGSGLLISLVGLSAIVLLQRNAERTSQAALAVIAE